MTKISTILAAAIALTAATSGQAGAVSLGVKLACAADYRAHCSQHAVGSPGVTKCMRSVGLGLSKGCLDALASAGYVSKSKIQRKLAAN
jgi:hypothetical protein